jgi:hypothetical protein
MVENYDIDGLVLDTAFKATNHYQIAILVAVWHNVGIPSALSLGPQETNDLSM